MRTLAERYVRREPCRRLSVVSVTAGGDTRMTIRMLAIAMGIAVSCSAVLAASKLGFPLDDALVPAKEIVRGGPQKDGIPSLDDPKFVVAGDAAFLKPKDRVLGISYNGVARAYPIKILNYHEIVNDVLNGEAVVVTYCPLCGSGMAFESTFDGIRLQFGVSGLLYNSDVLMYDRNSQSLWSQIKSMAISGPAKGMRLQSLPISHTSWKEWRHRFPETEVLTTNTGFRRDYRVDPYPNYSNSGKLYFPVSQSSNLYKRKEVVLGLEIRDQFKAYPFEELKKRQAQFIDEFMDIQFTVYFDEENKTARIVDEDGTEIATTLVFWFAWYAFHPDTKIYTVDGTGD